MSAEPKQVTVTMSSGKTYTGWVGDGSFADLLTAVGQTSGIFVLVMWDKKPPAVGAKSRTIYLRQSAIESVEQI